MTAFSTPIRYLENRSDFEWNVDYYLAFDGKVVTVTVGAYLTGVDPGNKQKAIWEKGVEKIWNNKGLFDDGHDLYPVAFDFNFVPSGPENRTILVHAGTGHFDANNWYLTPDNGPDLEAEVAAHEFGHMFGLFDEYQGGATLNGFTAADGLMANLSISGFERYFWPIEFYTEYFGFGDSSGTALATLIARNGDGGDDKMVGKPAAEAFYCFGGDDVVKAGDGYDYVDGGGDNDQLKGDSGNDRLFGRGGDDRLFGGPGLDVLDGGSGSDRYCFNSDPLLSGPDSIVTFAAKKDRIVLDDKFLPGLPDHGQLADRFFFKGAKAADKNDRIGYNPTTGELIYDRDGVDPSGDLNPATIVLAILPLNIAQFGNADIYVV